MNTNKQKYGIEQSIKGFILLVANSRRQHKLISSNRGNKRSAVSGKKIERPDREMDPLVQRSAVDGDSPLGFERILRPYQSRQPPFVRFVAENRRRMRN